MKRFKNILLITNKNGINSPDIKRAVSLARSNKANLTLADVVLDLPLIHRQLKPSPGIESVLIDLAKKRLKELKLMAKELSTEIDITPLVLQGTPFLEIIRVVIQHKCDLVIKISEPQKSFPAKFFGSTDYGIPTQKWIYCCSRWWPQGR